MPRKPPHPCKKPGCKALIRYGAYCPDHVPNAQARSEKKADPFYTHAAWRKRRLSYLKQHPLCERCGEPGQLVHHKEAIKAGGDPYADENLETLCPSCHSSEHGYGG